jgi:hypothetical protein
MKSCSIIQKTFIVPGCFVHPSPPYHQVHLRSGFNPDSCLSIAVATSIFIPKAVDSDTLTIMAIYFIEGAHDPELSGRVHIRLNEILSE